MKIIDLSHTIKEDMPVFPGTKPPRLENHCTLLEHGFREKLITMFSHTGTHMDAPSHMLEGLSLDQLSPGHFVGKVIVIEAKSYTVTLDELLPYEEVLKESDFVLLKTHWDIHWGSDQYFYHFPALSTEGATYLTSFNLKGYGVDAISVDHMEDHAFPIHHILLGHGMVLIENLTNLDQVQTGDLLSVLPLKIEDADGSPIRAVAIGKIN
jgi:kynurenine formamidase